MEIFIVIMVQTVRNEKKKKKLLNRILLSINQNDLFFIYLFSYKYYTLYIMMALSDGISQLPDGFFFILFIYEEYLCIHK